MTNHNFNDAEPQRSFDVIPDGTIATVRMTVRPGSAGEDGWLRRSKDGNSEALDCEFGVLDGPLREAQSLVAVHRCRQHAGSRGGG